MQCGRHLPRKAFSDEGAIGGQIEEENTFHGFSG
jgi:hypothetical protein